MRLIGLELANFRQHADSSIRFWPGLTGIIGPNGSGKSTILEAIAWAIYGAAAARGTNDTIRFARAAKRTRVEVGLAFELGGHEYRVNRTLHDAQVSIDGSADPAATGIGGTTAYLQDRLGMNREEFFNTYFTGQKELQFLANMGPTERSRFLNRLLGYERLRLAQDRVRERRGQLRHELDGLRAGQADPIVLEGEIEAARERLETATRDHDKAVEQRKAAAERLVGIVPRWTEAQERREAARETTHALESAQKDVDGAERDIERVSRELDAIADAATELASLERRVEAVPDAIAETDRFDELRRAAERREILVSSAQSLREELEATGARLKTLEQAPALVKQYTEELAVTRTEFEASKAEAERLRSDWSNRRQETSTRLGSYVDRAQELKDKIAELRKAGPDGTCPTCERPLRSEFDAVLGRLEDEYLELVQDGKWLRAREKQLASTPDDVAEAETSRDRLRAVLDEQTQRLARCEQAVQEIWTLSADRTKKQKRLDDLEAEIQGLPDTYDAEAHQAAEQRLEALRQVEKRVAALRSTLSARSEREAELEEARKRAASARRQRTRLKKRAESLDHSEEQYATLRLEHENAQKALHEAELRAVEQEGKVQAAEEARRAAMRELAAHRRREETARDLELDYRHHNELDSAVTRLRQDLNARVRPELSELASAFLADITDGRYTSIEIDDDYNVMVLDEGEEKPVISGGEEDIANLVLRLAISQMIAERAGQQLSILILDEVFGSLDLEHRDAVVQLLHKLEGRFEQVILITHVDGIREGLDNVLRVEFDERAGSSRVIEESVSGSLWTPQLV
jgi:exonuclease SbcC